MINIITAFQLSGLHCDSCKKITEKRVKKIDGVSEAVTDVKTGNLTINGIRSITKEEVINALDGTDYQVAERKI